MKTSGGNAVPAKVGVKARADELARFASRKDVPFVTARTPEKSHDPRISALSRKLIAFYASRGREARPGRVEPNAT